MANPRKFSEKIALQKQKQAEGTAEFEKIMKEVYATRRDDPLTASQQRIADCCLSPEQGGGIPIPGSGGGNGGGGNAGAGGGGGGGGGGGNGNGSGSPTAYRESRGRSVGVGPMRRPSDRKVDRSPYSSNVAYLSPPIDTNWRRSNSDSAIHQSLNMQPENPLYGGQQQQQQHYMQQQQQQQQHPYHPHQRSHSPAASVGLSPTAQRRKAQHTVTQSHSSSNLQQLQLQDQLNHHKLNHNHHLHMHPHQQSSMTKSQLQFNPCAPTNNVYKTLQEQALAMANTGSLPDLTSVHFSNAPSPSPAAITHNIRSEREQSQSPFNNSQSYQQQQQQQQQLQQQQQQQQHSSGGGLGAGQTHLSFTNLPVMVNPSSNNISANCSTLHSSYGHLPSIGGISANASSTGNLTEYRNPQHNPPSPAGSASPGLMVSTSPHGHSHDLHASAPNSPIRHHQQQQQQQQQYSDKNIQTYDRFSPSGDYSNSSNNLNPSFHNHFEQFSLVDSSAQSEPQYIPTSLQQDHSPHNSYSQSLQFEDIFGHHQQQFSGAENGNGASRRNDMGSLTSKLTGVSGSVTASSGGDPYMSMSNRNTLNNCSASLGLSGNSSSSGANGGGGSNNNNSSSGATTAAGTASASCSPLHSPHSPNPHNSSNNNSNLVNDIAAISQQQQQQQQTQQQKSHHTNDGGGGGGGGSNNSSNNMHNSAPTPTTPNIPSIVFSDFSSVNSDFSKEIFDTLDLDLGQMDVAGLQMLSDPSTIMIADPNIEDSFRRDLN